MATVTAEQVSVADLYDAQRAMQWSRDQYDYWTEPTRDFHGVVGHDAYFTVEKALDVAYQRALRDYWTLCEGASPEVVEAFGKQYA